MRITEALKILHGADQTAGAFPVALACGFTPLHLSTFLAAHLQQRLPNRRVEIQPGLYGDLPGALESLSHTSAHAIAAAVEWPDLDPRLGFRSTGQWNPADILSQVMRTLQRMAAALERFPAGVPVALSMPTLPLAPLFHTPGWQTGQAEAALDSMIANFSLNLPRRARVQLVNARRLAEDSPPAQRFDLKSDLITGLPYTLTHADALASVLGRLLLPELPKKGIITDLDDTLWSGLVGEVGPENVAWDLTSHRALHGLYQRLLAAFSQEGVLVAVASKNDAAVVAQAFQRADILIAPASIFPMEVHWDAKSASVARILKTWNISADSVVFIDDSPLELAEVAAAHPGIECIQFPGKDGGWNMLRRLRDLFGKARLSQEDTLRLTSIRNAAAFAGRENTPENFLQQLNAVISFDFSRDMRDPRALELVNKTNQFNLNGLRYTQTEWAAKTSSPHSVLAVVSYEDKFGMLGKIAVLQGFQKARSLRIDAWVMSCRAFSRRIEHQCIRMLFEHYGVDTIEFSFARTPKNGPLSDFLKGIVPPDLVLSRHHFDERCPALYHTVKQSKGVEVFNG